MNIDSKQLFVHRVAQGLRLKDNLLLSFLDCLASCVSMRVSVNASLNEGVWALYCDWLSFR